MNAGLQKFPRTPHLYWLGKNPARDDKVLTPPEAAAFLNGDLVIEEKVDGANLGFSLNPDGTLRFQNRGNFLEGKLSGQFTPLRGWVARHRQEVQQHLPPGIVLFGEWCRLKHSIHYTALPDWFLGFDALETTSGQFWGIARRDALLADLGMEAIRTLARGSFTRGELLSLLHKKSGYADAPLEGLYLRREEAGSLIGRAKLVRAEFTQSIGDHWQNVSPVENTLAGRAF